MIPALVCFTQYASGFINADWPDCRLEASFGGGQSSFAVLLSIGTHVQRIDSTEGTLQ